MNLASCSRFLPLMIGLRYTLSRREQRFISFVSLISLLGLIIGIMAMIVVLSVMNGFDRELKQRILKVIPHGFVESDDIGNWDDFAARLRTQPGIIGVAPLIAGNGLISFGDKTLSVQINGVLPELLPQVSSVADSMVIGKLDDLNQEPFGIILGQVLARRLGVTSSDKIQIVLPQVTVTPAGVFPRQKVFRVVGVFSVGADPDNELVLIHINSAARLFQQLHVDKTPLIKQAQLKTNNMEDADNILVALKTSLADNKLVIRSWADTHRTLFKAIKMEKKVISLLLFVVIAVAVFNIASILVMMVAEKRKDIAILRVMGADSKMIMRIFIVQGMLIGLSGIVIGAIFGSLLAMYMGNIMLWLETVTGTHLFSPDLYYIAKLPSDLQLSDVVIIIAASFVLCAIATLYPSWKSTRIDPVQALNE